MKRIIACILILAMALAVFSACGKKTEAVKAVEAMIDEIGEVTEDSAESLAKIQQAYAVLSADEQKRVKNHKKLEKALEELKAIQNRLNSIEEINDAIAAVIGTANTTFSKDSTDFTAVIEKGEAALKQYGELSKEDQARVDMSDDFKTALQTLKDMVDGTEKSAAEYVKAFKEVFKDEKPEITAVYCLKQLRDDTQYHIYALDYTGTDGEKHTVYANARCSSNTPADVIVKNAETFFAEEPISNTFNAVTGGNVTLDLEKVLKLAK